MMGGVEAWKVDRLRRYDDLVCALIRGEAASWPGTPGGEEVEEFLSRAYFHGMQPLLDDRFRKPSIASLWPEAIRMRCRSDALSTAAWSLAQRHELARLLPLLRAEGVEPLLLKGTALAYSHYQNPGLRPRSDVDILIGQEVKGRAEKVLRGLGYASRGVEMGMLISHQASWSRVDHLGAEHPVDLHWRSNYSPVLARLLGYPDMRSRSVNLEPLGEDAFAPCPVHALLFACIHRAGHQNSPYYIEGVPHPATERLIWLYDIHLLASEMSQDELEEAASLAARRRMATILKDALLLCRTRFGLPVSDSFVRRLSVNPASEPSARCFQGGRLRQMVGDVLALDGLEVRATWLRELAFPAAGYMREKYVGARLTWLPALYARRAIEGVRKLRR